MLPGITVQMFVHQHTDARVLAKPGSYRPGDIVYVYDGIPESKAELRALVGNVCAEHPRFAFFGVSDLTIHSPAVRSLLQKREELLGFSETGEPYTRLDRIRTSFIDYLSAPSATREKLLNKINLQTFTKAQIQTFIKNHS